MENTSHLLLSDYQRAVLNEMDISSWQLANENYNQQQTKVKVENQPLKSVATSSKVNSKEDALAKLKQLKIQTQSVEATDSVLVTFSQSATKLPIFADVLIALGLESKTHKHISPDEQSHYAAYPLSWTIGETISLNNKHLITPALSELLHSDIKRQLWKQLQSALSISNN